MDNKINLNTVMEYIFDIHHKLHKILIDSTYKEIVCGRTLGMMLKDSQLFTFTEVRSFNGTRYTLGKFMGIEVIVDKKIPRENSYFYSNENRILAIDNNKYQIASKYLQNLGNS